MQVAVGEELRARESAAKGLGARLPVAEWQAVWHADRWEVSGVVRVELVDGRRADVGVTVGVPPHLRGTAEEARGDTVSPYLDAWYAQASDWQSAPVTHADGSPAEHPGEALRDVAIELLRGCGVLQALASALVNGDERDQES